MSVRPIHKLYRISKLLELKTVKISRNENTFYSDAFENILSLETSLLVIVPKRPKYQKVRLLNDKGQNIWAQYISNDAPKVFSVLNFEALNRCSIFPVFEKYILRSVLNNRGTE